MNKKYFYILLFLGIGLRLLQYCFNRSVWFDEALLSLNIIDKDFSGLLKPLDNNQVAPVLFLFWEKLITMIAGVSELSLRFVPLLCGILCLPLIYFVTKEVTKNKTAGQVALFLFATSNVLIRYSTEVKQYECDVLSTLVLFTLLVDSRFNTNQNKRYVLLGLAGSILIFLSNITILVLFSIGVYHLLKHKGKLLLIPAYHVMLVMWAISFGIYYFLFIYHNPHQQEMLTYWAGSFMPLNIFSFTFVNWFYEQFGSLFDNLFSFPLLVVYLFSLIVFILKKQYSLLFFLVFPLFIHFIVSGFKLYPFETRLTIYLMAFMTPGIALGMVMLTEYLTLRINKFASLAVCIIILIPITKEVINNFHFKKEELSESISYLEKNYSSPQKIYVYYGAKPALEFYTKINLFTHQDVSVFGSANRNDMTKYTEEIKKINGEVWLLFSHIHPDNHGEEDFIISQLSSTHKIRKSFKTVGSSVYLLVRKEL